MLPLPSPRSRSCAVCGPFCPSCPLPDPHPTPGTPLETPQLPSNGDQSDPLCYPYPDPESRPEARFRPFFEHSGGFRPPDSAPAAARRSSRCRCSNVRRPTVCCSVWWRRHSGTRSASVPPAPRDLTCAASTGRAPQTRQPSERMKSPCSVIVDATCPVARHALLAAMGCLRCEVRARSGASCRSCPGSAACTRCTSRRRS